VKSIPRLCVPGGRPAFGSRRDRSTAGACLPAARIATGHHSLDNNEAGEFREDLYYRLNFDPSRTRRGASDHPTSCCSPSTSFRYRPLRTANETAKVAARSINSRVTTGPATSGSCAMSSNGLAWGPEATLSRPTLSTPVPKKFTQFRRRLRRAICRRHTAGP